jgi:hypothetical protein
MRFDLTDEEWAELEPLMPTKRKSARVDDRRVVNAILHVIHLVSHGAICPMPMARIRPHTTGSTAGRDAASGSAFSSAWQRNLAMAFTWSTAPWSRHTDPRPVPKGGGPTRNRDQPGWADLKDTRGR